MSKGVKILALAFIFASFAVSVWAGVQAAQTEAAAMAGGGGSAAPSASTQFAILLTTIAGMVSMLATQFFAMYRENRNRKWDLQDRETARAEMRENNRTLQIQNMQTATELARVSMINSGHLLDAIKENTEITTGGASKAEAAYSEANNFNKKLEALQLQLQKIVNDAEKQAEKKEA
jgi:hypothetical protein